MAVRIIALKFISKKFYFIFVIIVLLITFFLYRHSLNYYFFQDDFYEIILAKAKNFSQFLSLFKFMANRSSYRPLGLQLYFFSVHQIFGLNPPAFRIVSFLFLFLSYFLLFNLVTKITKNNKIGFLTATFWILSSIHYMSITWIAAAWLIIGTFFFLTTSLFFLKYLDDKKMIFYLPTLIAFLATIGSFEFFVAWPVIFGYYFYFANKRTYPNRQILLTKTFWIFLPFILLTIAYLIFRISFASLPQIREYTVSLNFESFKTLFWYGLWSFNIPEEFKKQVVTKLLIFNETFVLEFWPLILKSFLGASLIFFIGIVIPLMQIIRKKLSLDFKIVSLGVIWFIAAISPVIILPYHTFSMYLTLPSIGIYLLISYLLVNFTNFPLMILAIVIWIFTSFTTLSFYKANSWMVESQRFAREFTNNITEKFPTLPHNATVLYPENDKRHIQALSDQNAIKAIYDDSSLSIIYNKEDLSRFSNNFNKKSGQIIYIFNR